MPPKRGAWDDDTADASGSKYSTTSDPVQDFHNGKTLDDDSTPPPSGTTNTSASQPPQNTSDDGEEQPGCCSRCCAIVGKAMRFVVKAILYFFLYLFGFVGVLTLGVLHAVFRILHMIFNVFSQCRRADIDVMREFHYASGSDASGSEAEEEAEILAEIDAFERNEQRLIILGRGSQLPEGTPKPKVMSRPKKTREDIRAMRQARRTKKVDDTRRVVAVLNGQPDPGVQHGSTSNIYPPKFVSCGCCLSACVATCGMALVSVTFFFYALSYCTLLAIVALVSIMFPSTTVGGMKIVKEFQDHSDIVVRPPRSSAEQQQQQQAPPPTVVQVV